MGSLTGVLCGCGQGRSIEAKDPFLDLYSTKVDGAEAVKVQEYKGRLYDLTAHDMTLIQLAEWFSDHTGIGVIWSQEADSFKFSGEFRQAAPDEIMGGLSRRYGFEVVRLGKTFYLGKLQPEDRGFLIRRIRGFDAAEITGAVGTFLSTNGKLVCSPDGVLVVSDREAVLARIASMLDQLETSPGATWIVQYFILNIKKDVSIEAGAQVSTSGEISYLVSKGQGGKPSAAVDIQNLGQTLTAVLNASSSYTQLRASPMFLLRDGADGTWSDGETVPIPQKTISDYGTVTTTGFSFVDTGLSLKTHLRESIGGATLKTDFADSDIIGYVDYYPTVSKVQTTALASIESGKVYLLAELHRRKTIEDVQKIGDVTNGVEGRKMQIWCKCYRISPPVATLAPDWKEELPPAQSFLDRLDKATD